MGREHLSLSLSPFFKLAFWLQSLFIVAQGLFVSAHGIFLIAVLRLLTIIVEAQALEKHQ